MPREHHLRRFLWLVSLILGIALLDQLLKRAMIRLIGPDADQHRVEVLGRLFAFEYLENRGAAFGLFQSATALFAAVAIIAIGVGLFFVWRFAGRDLPMAVAICLIVGGAMGNAVDRIVRGYVVDYVAVGRFWKFNLADACISVGAVLLFILLWRTGESSSLQEDVT
ncbi:MAG: signal peptidase II [Thermomicrobiales bacterium]|nr:signal peptidase II [Thermomicrobiales bacterium]MCO5229189.1 signal peptidase II [Thermomicrobiales bacterium]